MRFERIVSGPFALDQTENYFGGWLRAGPERGAIAMAFPVEGWHTSAAVVMRQPQPNALQGEVYGAGGDGARAWAQALAVLSADSDGAAWPVVAQRDPVMGELQARYHFLRPVLFYSPYEAAAAFLIGHRISIQQRRQISTALAERHGDAISVNGETYHAFPRPQVLAGLTEFPGVPAGKFERLHGVAAAALDGWLDRATLRAMAPDEALARLRALRGVGDFFAQGILFRGAGLVDVVTDEEVTKEAVQRAYHLPQRPSHQQVLEIAENWRPYRMWGNVLLHVWLRREQGGPHRLPAQAGRWSRARAPK
jgi:DNA-3-methyladenine glycosylase II